MRNIITIITYLLVACSVVLLILVVFLNFKQEVLDGFIPPETNPPVKSTGEPETEKIDNPPENNTDGYDNNNDYVIPTGNPNVKPDEAVEYDGKFELPVNGATGYAAALGGTDVFANDFNSVLAVLQQGKGFRIIKEDGAWWQVYISPENGSGNDNGNGIMGWVRHNYCMINLPDVIPSIIYDNTNAYSSVFRANEERIPNITGEQLYKYSDRKDGKAYNERLQKDEYIVPVLYSMAERIYQAQQNAAANGDTLMIYEGFRPADTQGRVYGEVLNLPSSQKNFGGYSMSMFIAYGISNHQIGYAMDTSLAKIVETDYAVAGKYKYKQYVYLSHAMPCAIHELSVKATLANAKDNIPAQNLQRYCKDAGFSSLSSEWWHFNDDKTYADAPNLIKQSNGNYFVTECYSVSPGN